MESRTPSIRSIKDNFPCSDAKFIKLLLTDDDTVDNYNFEHYLLKGFFHRPERRYARMIALSHALGLYGVEHVGSFGERGFYYLSAGDPYNVTMIQFDDKESIFISTVGDVVENGKYR